jgi:hypothetical protein
MINNSHDKDRTVKAKASERVYEVTMPLLLLCVKEPSAEDNSTVYQTAEKSWQKKRCESCLNHEPRNQEKNLKSIMSLYHKCKQRSAHVEVAAIKHV